MENAIELKLDKKIYPLEVVYGACYNFIDRCYVFLDRDGNDAFVVQLKGKSPLDKEALEALRGEFANELINQGLRKKISQQNQRLREYIVSRALFSAETLAEAPYEDEELEEELELDEDFLDDPLQIAVPWDEKYGKDKKAETPGTGGAEGGEAKP